MDCVKLWYQKWELQKKKNHHGGSNVWTKWYLFIFIFCLLGNQFLTCLSIGLFDNPTSRRTFLFCIWPIRIKSARTEFRWRQFLDTKTKHNTVEFKLCCEKISIAANSFVGLCLPKQRWTPFLSLLSLKEFPTIFAQKSWQRLGRLHLKHFSCISGHRSQLFLHFRTPAARNKNVLLTTKKHGLSVT